MQVYLMFKDKKFDYKESLPSYVEDLIIDLGLDIIFSKASEGDEFIQEVIKHGILQSLNDIQTIIYRQEVLKDCINNKDTIKAIYEISLEAIKKEKESLFGIFVKHPDSIVYSSRQVLEDFFAILEKLKNIFIENESKFKSEGFRQLFYRIKTKLSDEYLNKVDSVLKKLRFENGISINAKLSMLGKPSFFQVMHTKKDKQSLIKSIFKQKNSYKIYIPEQDEGGFRALSEIKNNALNNIANTLANTVYYLLDFFNQLRVEIAFYLACTKIYEKLVDITSVCFPEIYPQDKRMLAFFELSEPSLALVKESKVVVNSLEANQKNIVLITGANMGGKTTFLRSIAIACLFSQCGMFVAAKSFKYSLSSGIFTHFKKQEDKTLKNSKFDEELNRLSNIVDFLKPHSIVFFNETFSSTNDHEASIIAKYITESLIEKQIRVFFVTHLYEFAYLIDNLDNSIFLKAQRNKDGTRTFKIVESKPEPKSYSEDLFKKIFNKEVIL
ncbi:MAG: MutS-related protein [Desulfurella sp.]|uniref:MutS-related protein n=1 Tax=Desulfurella sp. TaxID=1962857 RepID=UPI003D0E44FA